MAEVFEGVMAKPPGMLLRMKGYFRHVRWDVERNAISGDVVARCVQTGPVSVGWGSTKIAVSVDGDTVECRLDRPAPDVRGEVLVGPGTYSVWFGLYLFPATRYPVAVVKALRRADPTAQVRYPWSIVRIVALSLVLMAMLVSAVAGSGSAESSSAGFESPQAVAPSTPPDPQPPTPTDTDTDTASQDPTEDSLTETELEAGRYVRLGSFRSEAGAQREADRLRDRDIPAMVLDSNETAELMPAFFVVAVGPTDSSGEERRVIKRAGIDGALVSELGPAQADPSPATFEGSFAGTVKQVDPAVDRLNHDRGVQIELGPGGEDGSVRYARPRCTSNLTLTGGSGGVLDYSEEVVTGSCADGGTWSLKLDGSQLLATWWGTDGTTTFRIGRLDSE